MAVHAGEDQTVVVGTSVTFSGYTDYPDYFVLTDWGFYSLARRLYIRFRWIYGLL
jgi:hypothetical protein